jgi:hypothetical protein
MSRELPTGFASAMDAPILHPVFLAQIDWPTGTIRVWNGYGDLTWDGQTWVGVGHLGGISVIKESRDLAANGVTLSLSGIPSGNISLALANNTQGQPAYIWVGELDVATKAFTVDPYRIFAGIIDVCPIEDDGTTATINVNLEKEFIDTRTEGRRYTHEDQQIDYPGDLGFEYVAGLADKPLNWNGPSATGAGTTVEPGNNDGGTEG